MGMFDYKSYTAEESAELLSTAYRLSTYGNVSGFLGLPTRPALSLLADSILNSGLYPNMVDVELPAGWRELTPTDLSLPDSARDFSGHYIITSPLVGNMPTGEQAKILGEYDSQGKLTRVAVSFTGTNSPVDIPDYFLLNSGAELAARLEPLLKTVRDFVIKNGLTAEDVILTGYSLGGALANLTAEYRNTLAGGFFANANFVGCASPLVCDDPGVVLNYGYENDVVYRVIGDEVSWQDAITAAKPGLVNADGRFDSSLDNIVLFDDMYASPLWPAPAFSILNIPVAWYAHVDGVFSDAHIRIADNPFYEYMERDSTTVIANLSGLLRSTTWVQDKQAITSDHYGTSAFIIGSDYNDLLQGGCGGDYIYGGDGNDTIRTGVGADRIDGGSGKDTLRLEGGKNDWDAYRLSDGTLFFNAHDGSGLKQAESIEQISFQNDLLSWASPYDVTSKGLHDTRLLLSWFKSDVTYQKATEGSNGADALTGQVVFAKEGNDVLYATSQGSLLHGGEGNDIFKGTTGNDALYGAEGRDVLYSSKGNDKLYGGVGDDVFIFNVGSNNTHVMDFNLAIGDQDQLGFAKSLFASMDHLAAATYQSNADVLIRGSGFMATIHDATVQEVLNSSMILL